MPNLWDYQHRKVSKCRHHSSSRKRGQQKSKSSQNPKISRFVDLLFTLHFTCDPFFLSPNAILIEFLPDGKKAASQGQSFVRAHVQTTTRLVCESLVLVNIGIKIATLISGSK